MKDIRMLSSSHFAYCAIEYSLPVAPTIRLCLVSQVMLEHAYGITCWELTSTSLDMQPTGNQS